MNTCADHLWGGKVHRCWLSGGVALPNCVFYNFWQTVLKSFAKMLKSKPLSLFRIISIYTQKIKFYCISKL